LSDMLDAMNTGQAAVTWLSGDVAIGFGVRW
jgi:hypothetical protein